MRSRILSLPLLVAFVFGSLPSSHATAGEEIRVAWIKKSTSNGEVIRVEKDFDYYHVAVSTPRGWLHAHPWGGVQVSDDLSLFGTEFLELNWEGPEPTSAKWNEALGNWVGKSYDRYFDWATDDSLYCSELVAKLLGIRPQSLYFDPEIWGPYWSRMKTPPPQGLGISPGGLYREVKKRQLKGRHPDLPLF